MMNPEKKIIRILRIIENHRAKENILYRFVKY